MPDKENENTETRRRSSGNGGNATRTAMKAAAAAAATGAAAVAVKKALSSGIERVGQRQRPTHRRSPATSQSLMKSVASGSWDAAQDAIVPLAADAAAAAGKYLANERLRTWSRSRSSRASSKRFNEAS